MSTDEAQATEGVVVICCDYLKPEHVILQILGTETLPQVVLIDKDIKGYPWMVDTKYYTASVNLYALEEKKLRSSEFCNTVRATIFFFDSKKLSSFESVLSWMTYIQYFESDIQLLVCDNCTTESDNNELSRKTILDWCVKNHFELIELDSNDDDEEEEEIFRNVTGYARIVQALKAHTWANLELKNESHAPCQRLIDKFATEEIDASEEVDTDIKEMKKDEKCDSQVEETASNKDQMGQNGNRSAEGFGSVSNLVDDSMLLDFLGQDDPNGQSLEALFARFSSMKEKASSLTGDDRKKYAEKVALSFWRAIGGDEDEIAGLDD